MHKAILTAATLVLFTSAAMAQTSDTKGPATTGPGAQSDNMSKGAPSSGKMAKKSKSTKAKKRDDKM